MCVVGVGCKGIGERRDAVSRAVGRTHNQADRPISSRPQGSGESAGHSCMAWGPWPGTPPAGPARPPSPTCRQDARFYLHTDTVPAMNIGFGAACLLAQGATSFLFTRRLIRSNSSGKRWCARSGWLKGLDEPGV